MVGEEEVGEEEGGKEIYELCSRACAWGVYSNWVLGMCFGGDIIVAQ